MSRPRRKHLLTEALFSAVCLTAVLPLAAQDLLPPPDFSQPPVADASKKAGAAWTAWLHDDAGLERDALRLPMSEARGRLQRSFSEFLAYLDARKDYADKVGAFIENYRPETARGIPAVGIEPVNRDQLELLGVCLANLQSRLDSLRDAPEWAAIRRAVQADRSEVIALQGKLRDEIPVELPLSRPQAPRPLSGIVYRDSEARLRDVTKNLWSHYYQAVADAVAPGGKQLISSSAPPAAPETPEAPADSASVSRANPEKLVGTWEYPEHSQQFNGVEEPREVLLELAMDKGTLTGRYRASLADFDGSRSVDLRLVMVKDPKVAHDLTFNVKSMTADMAGQMKIELQDTKDPELMLVHIGIDGVPKGREIMIRR